MGRSVRRPKRKGFAKTVRKQKIKHTTPTTLRTELQHWDEKRTLKENYSALGLATDPNKSAKPRGAAGRSVVVALRKLGSGEEEPYEPPSEDEEMEGSEEEEEEEQEEDEEEEDDDGQRPVDELQAALESEAATLEPRVKPRLSESERRTTEQLVRKHGKNFEAQARDIKLNAHQLTAAQLRKRHAEYVRYYGAEKLAPPAPKAAAAPPARPPKAKEPEAMAKPAAKAAAKAAEAKAAAKPAKAEAKPARKSKK